MRVATLAEMPERRAGIDALSAACWPEFMLHGDNPSWMRLFDTLADTQLPAPRGR